MHLDLKFYFIYTSVCWYFSTSNLKNVLKCTFENLFGKLEKPILQNYVQSTDLSLVNLNFKFYFIYSSVCWYYCASKLKNVQKCTFGKFWENLRISILQNYVQSTDLSLVKLDFKFYFTYSSVCWYYFTSKFKIVEKCTFQIFL